MKRAVFKLTAPRIPEAALQTQIARALTYELAAPGKISRDGVVFWSVDIANYGGTTPGLRTSRGVIAGIPDLFVLYRGRAFFIELKAEDGSVSEVQQTLAIAITLAGARWGVARNIAETLALLDEWEIPRSHRLRE